MDASFNDLSEDIFSTQNNESEVKLVAFQKSEQEKSMPTPFLGNISNENIISIEMAFTENLKNGLEHKITTSTQTDFPDEQLSYEEKIERDKIKTNESDENLSTEQHERVLEFVQSMVAFKYSLNCTSEIAPSEVTETLNLKKCDDAVNNSIVFNTEYTISTSALKYCLFTNDTNRLLNRSLKCLFACLKKQIQNSYKQHYEESIDNQILITIIDVIRCQEETDTDILLQTTCSQFVKTLTNEMLSRNNQLDTNTYNEFVSSIIIKLCQTKVVCIDIIGFLIDLIYTFSNALMYFKSITDEGEKADFQIGSVGDIDISFFLFHILKEILLLFKNTIDVKNASKEIDMDRSQKSLKRSWSFHKSDIKCNENSGKQLEKWKQKLDSIVDNLMISDRVLIIHLAIECSNLFDCQKNIQDNIFLEQEPV